MIRRFERLGNSSSDSLKSSELGGTESLLLISGNPTEQGLQSQARNALDCTFEVR